MKNVLVIGASGFIGSHLVEQLINKGYKVAVLVRHNSHAAFLQSLRLELRSGDLLDKDSLVRSLKGIDIVFCAANIKPAGKSKEGYKKELFDVHVAGTKNLLDACRECGVRRIIYFSSVAAMGYEKGTSFYDDSFKVRPVDAYGKAKLEAERILNEAYRNKEADITILRPPGVFGERGLGAMHKIISFVEKGFVPVIGRGSNRQSIAYVGNIVNQAICVAQSQNSIGNTYITGDDRPYSVNELISAVCKAMNRNVLRIHIPLFLLMSAVSFFNFLGCIFLRRRIINKESIIAIAMERVFDSSKISKELGYKQEYDLEDGIKRTIYWHKRQDA